MTDEIYHRRRPEDGSRQAHMLGVGSIALTPLIGREAERATISTLLSRMRPEAAHAGTRKRRRSDGQLTPETLAVSVSVFPHHRTEEKGIPFMKRHLRDKVLIISGVLACPALLFILLPLLTPLLAGTVLGHVLTHDSAWLDAVVTVCGAGIALVFGARLLLRGRLAVRARRGPLISCSPGQPPQAQEEAQVSSGEVG